MIHWGGMPFSTPPPPPPPGGPRTSMPSAAVVILDQERVLKMEVRFMTVEEKDRRIQVS